MGDGNGGVSDVTIEGYIAVAGECRDTQGDISKVNNEMLTAINALPWTGNTRDMFQKTLDRWHIEFTKINSHLDQIADFLEDSAGVDVTTDANNNDIALTFF